MVVSSRALASLAQLIGSVSPDAARLLIAKHCNTLLTSVSSMELLAVLTSSSDDAVCGLIVECGGGHTGLRYDAPTKYVFDARLEELRRCLRADGFEVSGGQLTRLVPATEAVIKISDHLEQALGGSYLDTDGEVRRLLNDSYAAMSAASPDFNNATTKARIALETVVRRGAAGIAASRGKPAPVDSWGASLSFLRGEGLILVPEEEALAKVYTMISQGAHVPTGLTHEQWALLSRSFALSGTYFVVQKCLVP